MSTEQAPPTDAVGSFIFNVLRPGSSLDPTFLLLLDGAFGFLLLVLLSLAYLTNGNVHILVLMGIELALWASVKWFVNELKKAHVPGVPVQQEEKLNHSKQE